MKTELRPFSAGDVSALQIAANNKNISDKLRNNFPVPFTIKDANEYITSQSFKSPHTDFVIQADGMFAGRITVDLKDDIYSTTAEIGYWVAESHWKKGIATEAIKLMVQYIIEVFDRVRIFAVCFESNTGSRKALQNAGFELESIRKKAVIKNGQIHNDCIYTIIM